MTSETLGRKPTSFMCCGVRIDAHTPESACTELLCSSAGQPGRAVHLCNAYTLSLATRDELYRRWLNAGDLNLADGTPVMWIGRRLGFTSMDRRVYGPDLMRSTVDLGRASGLRHFLYGSTGDVLVRLEGTLRADYPGAEIVGRCAPPFRPLDPSEGRVAAKAIERSGADVVWVGLGTPHQDRVVHDLRKMLPATLVAVGAAFDFIAGTKKQAPPWVRDHGFEWAHRLMTEPRRLWKRYLVGNAVFVAGVARTSPRVAVRPVP